MKTISLHSTPSALALSDRCIFSAGTVLSLVITACLALSMSGCADGEPAQPVRQSAANDLDRGTSDPGAPPSGGGDDVKSETSPNRYVRMSTTKGNIVIRLFAKQAPISAENFLGYVDEKFYDGTLFHRVIGNFMIQGGGLDKSLTEKKTGEPIKNEWTNGLKNKRGRLAMARLGGQPDSATAQFFINVVDNQSLDQPQADGAAYAVFGEVIQGMSVVDAIKSVETQPRSDSAGQIHPNAPVEPIIINSVKRMSGKEGDALLLAARRRTLDAAAPVLKSQGVDIEKAIVTDTGLWYIDIAVGKGESPSSGTRIEVKYDGWLTDGTKFDSTDRIRRPTHFRLAPPTIEGWIEGAGGMKVGGKRWLIIPPELGYGNVVRGGVPVNSVLIFNAELVDIL